MLSGEKLLVRTDIMYRVGKNGAAAAFWMFGDAARGIVFFFFKGNQPEGV